MIVPRVLPRNSGVFMEEGAQSAGCPQARATFCNGSGNPGLPLASHPWPVSTDGSQYPVKVIRPDGFDQMRDKAGISAAERVLFRS